MAKQQTVWQQRSDKKNAVHIGFKFSKSTDKDILDKLEELGPGNRQAYIKRLIREDIAKGNS